MGLSFDHFLIDDILQADSFGGKESPYLPHPHHSTRLFILNYPVAAYPFPIFPPVPRLACLIRLYITLFRRSSVYLSLSPFVCESVRWSVCLPYGLARYSVKGLVTVEDLLTFLTIYPFAVLPYG